MDGYMQHGTKSHQSLDAVASSNYSKSYWTFLLESLDSDIFVAQFEDILCGSTVHSCVRSRLDNENDAYWVHIFESIRADEFVTEFGEILGGSAMPSRKVDILSRHVLQAESIVEESDACDSEAGSSMHSSLGWHESGDNIRCLFSLLTSSEVAMVRGVSRHHQKIVQRRYIAHSRQLWPL